MRHLSVFILDSRYSVPTLRFDVAVAEGDESDLAERILEENSHYTAVEMRDGSELILRVERPLAAAWRRDSAEGGFHGEA